MNTREILANAKNILVTKGRTTTTLYEPETGCYCALGAVVTAEGWKYDASANQESQNHGYVIADRSLAVPVLNTAISKYVELNPERFNGQWGIWRRDPKATSRIFGFNDDRHIDDADVLNVFDLAIEMADAA